MTSEPRWLPHQLVLAIHDEQLVEHGGMAGVRDPDMLASALSRPRNKWHYEGETDLATLAAAYVFGIAKNRPFVDGNKRTATVSAAAFLGLNGRTWRPDRFGLVINTEGLADGSVSEAEYAAWIARGRP